MTSEGSSTGAESRYLAMRAESVHAYDQLEGAVLALKQLLEKTTDEHQRELLATEINSRLAEMDAIIERIESFR